MTLVKESIKSQLEEELKTEHRALHLLKEKWKIIKEGMDEYKDSPYSCDHCKLFRLCVEGVFIQLYALQLGNNDEQYRENIEFLMQDAKTCLDKTLDYLQTSNFRHNCPLVNGAYIGIGNECEKVLTYEVLMHLSVDELYKYYQQGKLKYNFNHNFLYCDFSIMLKDKGSFFDNFYKIKKQKEEKIPLLFEVAMKRVVEWNAPLTYLLSINDPSLHVLLRLAKYDEKKILQLLRDRIAKYFTYKFSWGPEYLDEYSKSIVNEYYITYFHNLGHIYPHHQRSTRQFMDEYLRLQFYVFSSKDDWIEHKLSEFKKIVDECEISSDTKRHVYTIEWKIYPHPEIPTTSSIHV